MLPPVIFQPGAQTPHLGVCSSGILSAHALILVTDGINHTVWRSFLPPQMCFHYKSYALLLQIIILVMHRDTSLREKVWPSTTFLCAFTATAHICTPVSVRCILTTGLSTVFISQRSLRPGSLL